MEFITHSCKLSDLILENKEKILKLFYKMKYGEIIILKEIDKSCYCGECGDEGIRDLIQLRKSYKLIVEPYFNEELYDVVDFKNIPGLEFWIKLEQYNEINKKYEPWMYEEELIFRIDINEKKQKMKLRHYRSFNECECNLPDVCIDKNSEYLELSLKRILN